MKKEDLEQLRSYFDSRLEDLSEVTRLKECRQYMQHGHISVYEHSVRVAFYSLYVAEAFSIPVEPEKLIRGALLHDYFLYDWHTHKKENKPHGIKHPMKAYRNASEELNLDPVEKDIILRHMFPLTLVPPKYLETWIVSCVDKVCTIWETLSLGSLRRKMKKVWNRG